MKDTIALYVALVMLGVLFAAPVLANSSPMPLLSMTQMSGEYDPAYQSSSECMIYPNKVVIKRQAGVLEGETIQRLKLMGPIRDLIEVAESGELVEEEGFLGGPSGEYMAYTKEGEEVILMETGFLTVTNVAPEAGTLITFLNLNCN